MKADSDFDAMADACINAAEHVNRCGSSELRSLMRMLLFLLGTDIARRSKTGEQESVVWRGDAAALPETRRLQ